MPERQTTSRLDEMDQSNPATQPGQRLDWQMHDGLLARIHRQTTRYFDKAYTTNGLAFSPDGSTMYFSDSNPAVRTIWSCQYDPGSGIPDTPQVFFDTRQVEGRPDGGTVDADGCYWMAGVSGGQLVRITPQG